MATPEEALAQFNAERAKKLRETVARMPEGSMDGEVKADEIKGARELFQKWGPVLVADTMNTPPEAHEAIRAKGPEAVGVLIHYVQETAGAYRQLRQVPGFDAQAFFAKKIEDINARPLDKTDPAVALTYEAMKQDYLMQPTDVAAARAALPGFFKKILENSAQAALQPQETREAFLQQINSKTVNDLANAIGHDAAQLAASYVQNDLQPEVTKQRNALRDFLEKAKAAGTELTDEQHEQYTALTRALAQVPDEVVKAINARPANLDDETVVSTALKLQEANAQRRGGIMSRPAGGR